MLEIQTSLNNLRALIKENNADYNRPNYLRYKTTVTDKIESIIQQMDALKVEPELTGSFRTVYNLLVLVRGSCTQQVFVSELPESIERIYALFQIHFHTTQFNDAEKEVIKNFPDMVSFFCEAKEKMALGEFGNKVRSMVIDNFDNENIAQFAILNLLKKDDKLQIIEKLKVEGKKMLEVELINPFLHLCDQLTICDLNQIPKENRALLCKKFANEDLDENEKAKLDDMSCKLILDLVEMIPQYLKNNSPNAFKAIMKGASVSTKMLNKEITMPLNALWQQTTPLLPPNLAPPRPENQPEPRPYYEFFEDATNRGQMPENQPLVDALRQQQLLERQLAELQRQSERLRFTVQRQPTVPQRPPQQPLSTQRATQAAQIAQNLEDRTRRQSQTLSALLQQFNLEQGQANRQPSSSSNAPKKQ